MALKYPRSFERTVLIDPPVEVLSRIVGAYEENYVDLAPWVPMRATHAILLSSVVLSGVVAGNLLQVGHGIYDNLVDYNVYGNINLYKAVGDSISESGHYFDCLVKLTNARYAYDISGAFNLNTVFIRHWLKGYVILVGHDGDVLR